MSRVLSLAYGVVSYLVFFASFLYAIGFIGNFGVPTTLDGTATASTTTALLINLGLLALFAVQHSVMARPTFKRWWTQIVPIQVERSTYTLFSSLALIALFALWQPMGGSLWTVTGELGRGTLFAIYAFGWALLLYVTFLINHFDLFGLRQVWLHFRGREYESPKFVTPWLYQQMRHPLYVAWLIIFWATPTMTVAHLLFAVMTTGYILIAIQLEERNLIDEHGESYRAYRKRVPMLIPRKRAAILDAATEAA
jgi:protein-S-isoprenylcysteine O-methyltransferase Ste14